jgi:hypothetical protein
LLFDTLSGKLKKPNTKKKALTKMKTEFVRNKKSLENQGIFVFIEKRKIILRLLL